MQIKLVVFFTLYIKFANIFLIFILSKKIIANCNRNIQSIALEFNVNK